MRRRGPPTFRLPRWVPIYVLAAACLAWGFCGCKGTGTKLVRWSMPTVLAVVGAALGGPLGAGLGALGGAMAGESLSPDKPKAQPPTTVINNAPGGVVNSKRDEDPVESEATGPLSWAYANWEWLAIAAVALRFRVGLIAFFQNLLAGAFGAAGMTSLGILLGGKASEKAKAMTANVRRRRVIVSPIGPGASTTGPHS